MCGAGRRDEDLHVVLYNTLPVTLVKFISNRLLTSDSPARPGMLSSSRTVVRIFSRSHNGARLLAASQTHRAKLPDASLHTQHLVTPNPKVSLTRLNVTQTEVPSFQVSLVLPQASQRRHCSGIPSHQRVNLPALSPTMELGTIVSWEKKEGDQVSEGDLLCEIETDKATMGFETPEEGYLAKIIIPAGSKDIPIGKLLCIIVENQEDVAKFKDFVDDGSSSEASPAQAAPPAAAAPPPRPAATPPPPPPPPPTPSAAPTPAPAVPRAATGGRAFASPAAKRLAAERGIDLTQIQAGSGMDGMITSKDVEKFKAPAAAPVAAPAMATTAFPAMTGPVTDLEASNVRKVIAKRLQQSKQTVPHYYLTVECNMDKTMQLRQEINTSYEKEGVKLSVNDFIIKAAALSCKRVPACNSAWMETFIRQHNTVDMSVAVDTGNGLITPIVKGAESKGLAEISQTVKELAGRAKEGKLQPQEFQGGTFTISNLGMFGINQFTAIINPPQACILAVGGTEKKVVAGPGGEPTVVNMMRVTMSCDHRVVDGAVGAQWLQHFKKFVENPQSMLL